MSHHYRKTRLALAVAAFVGGAGQIPPAQAQSQPAQAEFRVNTYTANNQVSPAIAMDAEGDFVVSWQSQFQDGSGFGIYAQRYNAAGTPQGSEFRVNTTTVNSQISPAIAMDADGDFVVSWQSGQIYAQRYNAAGTPQGSEFKVNTTTANSESDPAIAMDADGDFVVSWESSYYEYGSPNGIYAQRYNAAGTPQGSEFKVNTTTANNQSDPAIAMDADGDFVVSWQSSLTDIYVQRYNAAGTPQGSEFKVNTTTANNQVSPAIAMDADSDFVVSWASNSQDGSLYGIYAQRYNAAGTPQGSEFRVNTYTTNNQDSPAIAMAADGDFVLSWASKLQDGSLNGIYAQRFAAPVDLSLTGTQSTDPTPGYAQVNGSVTYSYGLQNLHNSESAHRVEIFFNLPPAFSYDTFSGADWSCVNTPPLTCSYGPTLAPGATAETLDLTLNMPATPIKADVIANSFSTQSETNAANNSSVLRTIVCDTGATDSIKVSSLSVSEAAGLVSVGVTRSGGACSAAAVNYATSNGTATAGSDYTAVSGTLNWAATEQGEKTVMVPVTQDALHEGQETITLALSSGGSGGSATLGAPGKITILDDDPLPTVRLSTGNKSITEAGISATITATLSALSGRRVTVPFTRSGTAVLDSDYLLSDTTLVIPAGRLSASLTLVGKNDALDEDDETAIVTMGTPLNATATAPISNTITILDDDPVPTVSLSTGNQSVSEAGGSATVTATLSALSGRNVTVPVARSGKAKFNSDYFLSPTTIVIPAGGLSASMTLVGKDDAFDEAYETAILTMSTPLNASATGTTSNTITIDDDDAPPTVAFVTARSNVTEGSANAGQSVTVMLSAPSGKAVSVSVKQIGGIVPGTDYSMVNGGNIKIPAGANTAASVMVLDDTEAETDEQVRFELSAPVNATLGTKTTHSLTIVDND